MRIVDHLTLLLTTCVALLLLCRPTMPLMGIGDNSCCCYSSIMMPLILMMEAVTLFPLFCLVLPYWWHWVVWPYLLFHWLLVLMKWRIAGDRMLVCVWHLKRITDDRPICSDRKTLLLMPVGIVSDNWWPPPVQLPRVNALPTHCSASDLVDRMPNVVVCWTLTHCQYLTFAIDHHHRCSSDAKVTAERTPTPNVVPCPCLRPWPVDVVVRRRRDAVDLLMPHLIR